VRSSRSRWGRAPHNEQAKGSIPLGGLQVRPRPLWYGRGVADLRMTNPPMHQASGGTIHTTGHFVTVSRRLPCLGGDRRPRSGGTTHGLDSLADDLGVAARQDTQRPARCASRSVRPLRASTVG
jgi:hypothetical protein